MSTSTGKGVNNLVRRIRDGSVFPDATNVISTSSNWQQGDLLAWDATNKIINSALSLTDVGTLFLGIAEQSVTAGVMNDPYQGLTDVTPKPGAIAGPGFGNVYSLQGLSGDVFAPGCLVYPDYTSAHSRQVSSTSGSNKAIGVYQGAQVTAGTSTFLEVFVGCRFPQDTLKF